MHHYESKPGLPISVGGKTVAGRDGDFLVGEELLPHSEMFHSVIRFRPTKDVAATSPFKSNMEPAAVNIYYEFSFVAW